MGDIPELDFNDENLESDYNDLDQANKNLENAILGDEPADAIERYKEQANEARKRILRKLCINADISNRGFIDELDFDKSFDEQDISEDNLKSFNEFKEAYNKSVDKILEKLGIKSFLDTNPTSQRIVEAVKAGKTPDPEDVKEVEKSLIDKISEKFTKENIKLTATILAYLSALALAIYILVKAGGPCNLLGQITSQAYSGCFYTSQDTGNTQVLPPTTGCDPTNCCNGCSDDVSSSCNNCCNAAIYPKVNGKLVKSGDIFQYRCKGILSTAIDAAKDLGDYAKQLTDPSNILKFFETIGIGLAIVVGVIIVFMIIKYIISYMNENLEEREMARKTLEREEY